MTTVAESQINQWLEEGLRHYGLGDPAKALDVWLRVLAAEPDNSRAKEYVEIVRSSAVDDKSDAPVETATAPATAAGSGASTATTTAFDKAPVDHRTKSSPRIDTAASDFVDAALSDVLALDPTISTSSTGPTSSSLLRGAAEEDTVPLEKVTSPSSEQAIEQASNPKAAQSTIDDDDGFADTIPPTDTHVDPLDSIDGPSWADVASNAEVASEAFSTSSYSMSSSSDVVGGKTEIQRKPEKAQTGTVEELPLAGTAQVADEDTGKESGGVTSGAAGPIEVLASNEESEPTSAASVSILRAAPIEETVSNVVHSVRYGDNYEDTPTAGPFFVSMKEKAREEVLAEKERKATESLEFSRSEILTSAMISASPSTTNTVELSPEEIASASNPVAGSDLPLPPADSTLVDALDNVASDNAAFEDDLRGAPNAPTIEIPKVAFNIPTTDALAQKAEELARMVSGANPVSNGAPKVENGAGDLFDLPDVHNDKAPDDKVLDDKALDDKALDDKVGEDLFAGLPQTEISDESEKVAGSLEAAPSTTDGPAVESGSESQQDAWGDEGAPTMDLDVDNAAPSMFDLLLAASDSADDARTMDVGGSKSKRKPEDGKRGASQDLAPLMSTPKIGLAPKTSPEVSLDSADEKPECDVLMDGARELFSLGDFSGSLELVEKVLEIDPEHTDALSYFKQNSSTLIKMYESKLGDLQSRPTPKTSADEVIWMNMHHRAGFVLSQVDGMLTYEEIADVSGLPRLETFRILSELKQNGVIG